LQRRDEVRGALDVGRHVPALAQELVDVHVAKQVRIAVDVLGTDGVQRWMEQGGPGARPCQIGVRTGHLLLGASLVLDRAGIDLALWYDGLDERSEIGGLQDEKAQGSPSTTISSVDGNSLHPLCGLERYDQAPLAVPRQLLARDHLDDELRIANDGQDAGADAVRLGVLQPVGRVAGMRG
jgi:hypothetical protein